MGQLEVWVCVGNFRGGGLLLVRFGGEKELKADGMPERRPRSGEVRWRRTRSSYGETSEGLRDGGVIESGLGGGGTTLCRLFTFLLSQIVTRYGDVPLFTSSRGIGRPGTTATHPRR